MIRGDLSCKEAQNTKPRVYYVITEMQLTSNTILSPAISLLTFADNSVVCFITRLNFRNVKQFFGILIKSSQRDFIYI